MPNLLEIIKRYWQSQPNSTRWWMVIAGVFFLLWVTDDVGDPSKSQLENLRAQIESSDTTLAERAKKLTETETLLAEVVRKLEQKRRDLQGLVSQADEARATLAAAKGASEALASHQQRLDELNDLIAQKTKLAAYVAPESVENGMVFHEIDMPDHVMGRWIDPAMGLISYDYYGAVTVSFDQLSPATRKALTEKIASGRYLGATALKLEPSRYGATRVIDWDANLVLLFNEEDNGGEPFVQSFDDLSAEAQAHLEALRPQVSMAE